MPLYPPASSGGSVDDTAFASSWNGVTGTAPSKNAVYDWAHTLDTDDDGKVNVLGIGAGIVKTDSGGVVSAVTAPSGAIVGDTDTQTLTNKTFDADSNTPTKLWRTVHIAQFTTTNTTATDITGANFSVAASKNYAVIFHLVTNVNSGSAGMKFTLTGPASPTLVNIRLTFSTTALSSTGTEFWTGFGSTTATAVNAYVGDGHFCTVFGMISNGSNAGTVQLQVQKVTSQTAKIYAGSWISWALLN